MDTKRTVTSVRARQSAQTSRGLCETEVDEPELKMNPSFAPEQRKEVLRLRHMGTNGHGAVVDDVSILHRRPAIDGQRRFFVKLRMTKIAL